MYDLISALIDHEYVSNYGGDQQYIYYITGTLIILFSVVIIDMLYRLIRSIWKKGDF